MKVRKALSAAVEAGRISEEDAAKRYEGAEKAIRETMAAGRSECVGPGGPGCYHPGLPQTRTCSH